MYEARKNFLFHYAELVYENDLQGSVAEAGVYRGEFAQYINEYFPDRTCYLFDTFSGFEVDDVDWQSEKFALEKAKFINTSSEYVISRMPHPECVTIRKGWFPDTAKGIDDKFVFVNLDMDLYKPTIAGLKFFYPKLVQNGVILLHDYYDDGGPGIKKAVTEFSKEEDFSLLPIGDDRSIALIKSR